MIMHIEKATILEEAMSSYNIIAATNENTVVTEYTPEPVRSDAYQSEAELEKESV